MATSGIITGLDPQVARMLGLTDPTLSDATDAPIPAALRVLADHLDPSLGTDAARPCGTDPAHPAAVLALFSDTEDPSLVLTLRADTLRDHPGQISFPGGAWEPGDTDALATALREAREEIGLDPTAVHALGRLPARRIPVSGHDVVTVVGWCAPDVRLGVADPREVERILRWPVSDLADPANRVTSTHPGGHTGPAWVFGDDFLWGFTAMLVDRLLELGGWARPWDHDRVVPVPGRYARSVQRR